MIEVNWRRRECLMVDNGRRTSWEWNEVELASRFVV